MSLSPARCWSLAAVLFLAVSGCTGSAKAPMVSPADSLQIYCVPEQVETFAALRPEDLRRIKTGFAEFDEPIVAAEAWDVARSDAGDATAQFADVRWGLRILDANHRILAEYYVDRTGTVGYAATHRVRFSGHLREWLRARLGLFANY